MGLYWDNGKKMDTTYLPTRLHLTLGLARVVLTVQVWVWDRISFLDGYSSRTSPVNYPKAIQSHCPATRIEVAEILSRKPEPPNPKPQNSKTFTEKLSSESKPRCARTCSHFLLLLLTVLRLHCAAGIPVCSFGFIRQELYEILLYFYILGFNTPS